MSSVDLGLADGARVGVIGGGPAGSLFAYFVRDMGERLGTDVHVDIYEPRDFEVIGPAGCNMCGGIVSESLVQALASEGIELPGSVVERSIDSYLLHMPEGSVAISTPLYEKRIASVHRGAGPRGQEISAWSSFDGYLLRLATGKGAVVVRDRVHGLDWVEGRPRVTPRQQAPEVYDLVAVATGVNSTLLKVMEQAVPGYRAPRTVRAHIAEFCLGREVVKRQVGSAVHIFLLDVPGVEFAALIPKGDFVSLCVLGRGIDGDAVQRLLASPQVRRLFPPGWTEPARYCHCSPLMQTDGARGAWGDRVVFLGDSAVSRLYKDGIGAAYRTAKAAAVTALLRGIAARDFERGYEPVLASIRRDNACGRLVLGLTRGSQRRAHDRRGILRLLRREQHLEGGKRRMSMVLWDVFTGSAPYRDILSRSLSPVLMARLAWQVGAGLFRGVGGEEQVTRAALLDLTTAGMGKAFKNGEVIVREGEEAESLYFVTRGTVEVLRVADGHEVRLAELHQGDLFGEMALFDGGTRSATVRAVGDARVLTIQKRAFLQRVHEDPSMAWRIIGVLSSRIRELNEKLLKAGGVR